jgi:membrane protein
MKFKKTIKDTGHLLKETFHEFNEDNGMKLSAALSYYTIFSLPPLLLIIVSITGFFFGAEAVKGEIYGEINGLVGHEAAMQIQDILKNVKLSGSNNFATTISVIVLIIGASGVFAEIQESINYIWRIKAKPKKGFIKFLKNRLMSFSMIGSVGFLLMVGLVVNSVMDILGDRIAKIFPVDTVYLIFAANLVVLFTTITVLFTVIFKTLPDGKIVLKDCIIGAAFTAFLFMIGKYAIGAYLGRSATASFYGAAGSIILILIWVYYSAIILYFGAEFTKVYAHVHGENIIPNEYSVKVIKEDIEIEPIRPRREK